MARKKREPEAKPAAGWITTFSDLMNLLLCFFVLLFSMSTVDAEKFQMVIASLQSRQYEYWRGRNGGQRNQPVAEY